MAERRKNRTIRNMLICLTSSEYKEFLKEERQAMTEKEKQLLDILERTKRIRKFISTVNDKIDKDDFLKGFVGSLVDNAENSIVETKERLQQIKEKETDND